MSASLFRRAPRPSQADGPVFLVLGLGNPGAEYAETPHNAGFLAADALAEQLGARYWKSQGGALVSAVTLDGVRAAADAEPGTATLIIAKPQDYMNRSGSAAKNLSKKYGVPADRVIVIHDDLDLPNGDVRCKEGGGHAGHNGLRSVHDRLGTDGYLRVRVGVGRPPGKMDPAKYVLRPWRGQDLEGLKVASATAADAVIHIVRHGISSAMNLYNRTS